MIIVKFCQGEPVYYQGETKATDRYRLDISFPFGYLPQIKQSQVILMVGLSYGKGDMYWQNATFYDSKCKTCNDGIVKMDLVEIILNFNIFTI